MGHIPGSPLSPQDRRWWTKTVHPHDGPTHHIPPHSLHLQNTLNQIHWGEKRFMFMYASNGKRKVSYESNVLTHMAHQDPGTAGLVAAP